MISSSFTLTLSTMRYLPQSPLARKVPAARKKPSEQRIARPQLGYAASRFVPRNTMKCLEVRIEHKADTEARSLAAGFAEQVGKAERFDVTTTPRLNSYVNCS